MAKVILHKQDSGLIAVIRPSVEALKVYTYQQIGEMLTPGGFNFKIVEESELPPRPHEEWDFPHEFYNSGSGTPK